GRLPTGFHTYRVQPIATGFQFYIDDVLKATVGITFPAGAPTRIVLSAFNGAPDLQADWVRLTDYTTTGTFTSTVFDAGQSVAWQVANWTASVPAGTALTVEVSTSNSATGGWSNWIAPANGT